MKGGFQFLLLCCLVFNLTVPAFAQTDQSYGGSLQEYDPTPKAQEITRYGNLPVDLNSGVVSMEIPVWTYRDRDFTIPVSLRYSSSGFRPGEPTGEAGLGWTLMAGGAITREVRGLDDFGEDGYKGASYPSALSVYNLNSSVSLTDMTVPRYSSSDRETSSDIYRFTMPGHSGGFLIGNDGEYHCFATSDGIGTYTISDCLDGFTITAGDGYKYTFGSSSTAQEVQAACNGVWESLTSRVLQDKEKIVVTWLLEEIEAPNGRKVVFSYSGHNTPHSVPDTSWTDVVTSFGPGLNPYPGISEDPEPPFYKYATQIYTSYLTGISVQERGGGAEKTIFSFSWQTQYGKEEPSGSYSSAYTKLITKLKKLSTISCSEGSTVLRTATLSYALRNNRPLLTGVSLGDLGSWTMEYESGTLPGLLTNAVDYWGFYNAKDGNTDPAIAPTSIDSNYDEYIPTTTVFRDPDTTGSMRGMLKKITWPTGGNTTITYEANRAGRIVLRRSAGNFLPDLHSVTDMLHSDLCGGVRVRSITDDDGLGHLSTRSFLYTDSLGQNSGIVQQFNRYFVRLQTLNGHTTGVMAPQLRFPGSGFDQRHVAYASVVEVFDDGSSTRTDFTSWMDAPDEFSTNARTIPYTSPSGYGTDYDNYLVNIFREPDSRAYRRGLPKKVTLYDDSGNIVRETSTDYTDVGDGYAAYVVRCDTAWYSARRFLCDRRPQVVTTVDRPSTGTALSSSVTYTYDAKGRNVSTETLRWDGSAVRSETEYYPATNAPSLLPYLLNSYTKPAGGSSFAQTEATEYNYAHVDSLWNLTSEVHTLYGYGSSGSWSGNESDIFTYSQHDALGNPRQASFNGLNHAFVWGYGGRYLVADVKGGQYTDLPTALRSTLSGALSDSQTAALHALAGKEVRTFTYSPSVGATRIIDRSGRSLSYGYDGYGRLTSESNAYGLLKSVAYGTEVAGQTTLRKRSETTYNGSAWSRTDWTVYDGLGRPYLEVVGKVTGNNPQELASLHHYDALNREDRIYLPHAVSTASVTNAASQQQSYWNGLYAGEGAYAFAERTFGGGTLSRLSSEMAPGSVMRTANKKTAIQYGVNAGGEVPAVSFNEASGGVSVSGYRVAGTLLRTATTSPDGNLAVVFSDLDGNPILERRISGAEYLDTHYAYDLHGRLRWVLTPGLGAAVRSAASSGGMTISSTAADAAAWCYVYLYGQRGDIEEVRTPGAGRRLLEYDAQHRVVLERPAIFGTDSLYIRTYYDALGRLVNNAVFRPDSADHFILKADGTQALGPGTTVQGTHLMRTRTYASSSSVDCITADTPGTPYANVPSVVAFLTVSGIAEGTNTHINGELLTERLYLVDNPVDPVGLTPIGIRDSTYVSEESVLTAFYYDNKGRVVQRVTSWPDGSLTRKSTAYDSVGNVVKSLEQYRPGTLALKTDWLLTENVWDTRGNLLTSSVWIGRGSSWSKASAKTSMVTSFTYDGTGRPTGRTVTKGSHSVATTTAYTLQGWTASETSTSDNAALFSETLRYWLPSRGASTAQYSGRISEMTSVHTGFTSTTKAYSYDGFGRYAGANSYSGTSTTATHANTEREVFYDAAGGITGLRRYDASATLAADLTYERDGNRLYRVTDDVAGATWSFTYDGGGNLTRDGRTGDYFAVNVLGLTAQVGRKAGGVISQPSETASYSYLADGTKIAARFSNGDEIQYRGSFVYRKTTGLIISPDLEAVTVPGGMVLVSGTTWTPYAYVKDHLGSTRAIVNLSTGTAVEHNDYYAFGTKIASPASSTSFPQLSTNRWRYSGKEEQDAVTGLQHLDYGARHYDLFLGSWTTPDPMSEKYYGWSPYAFCADDPVCYFDPNGSNWYSYKDKKGNTQYDYYERQLSEQEINAKGYTDKGFCFVDPETGSYYSLFGKIVSYPKSEAENIEYQLYQKIDALIKSDYSVRKGSKENFFLNVSPGLYTFEYGGASFVGKGTFYSLDNEKNSWLHISLMPSPKTNYRRTGIMISSDKGYQMVFVNDTERSFDPVSVIFTEENYRKFNSALNSLFKNYTQVLLINSMRQ